MCSGRQSRPHLFHVVRKVCTKSGHVSTIPPVVKNNSHHGISTIKSDYPKIENGDCGVSIGNIASVLNALGLSPLLSGLAAAQEDSAGLMLEERNLPQRVRSKKKSAGL